MGQTESKVKGSVVFAYSLNTANNSNKQQQYYPRSCKKTDINDNVLNHPENYGLIRSPQQLYSLTSPHIKNKASSSLLEDYTSSHNTIIKRPDSGYIPPILYDQESDQLQKDLAYVDHAYYPDFLQQSQAGTQQKQLLQPVIASKDSRIEISFADVMLSSSDKTAHEADLCFKSIYSLSPNMGMLTMIRKLDLSNNHLTELPESIGYMKSLQTLTLSKNRIVALPDTIGYLSNLSILDLSYNEIQHLTPCIGHLNKLETLSLAYNQIERLPTEMGGLVKLTILDLTRNPLRVLPAEVSQLPLLRRMKLDDCPFNNDMVYSLLHQPPSLVEICARKMIRNGIDVEKIPVEMLPERMKDYVNSAKSCTSCHGPYYESCVLRGRLMEKTDMHIPLEYTLCSAHWSDANDRIISMFSPQPDTKSNEVYLPRLPTLPKQHQTLENKVTIVSRKPHDQSPAVVNTATTISTTTVVATMEHNNQQMDPAIPIETILLTTNTSTNTDENQVPTILPPSNKLLLNNSEKSTFISSLLSNSRLKRSNLPR